MIVLSGASASGKTEAAKELAAKYNILKVITTTTRAMRTGETNGKDYFFVSNEEFNAMLQNNEFVEITKYNNNLYGSTKKQIADNKCIIVDPLGLKAYNSLENNKIISFFLDASEKTRFTRMINRGDDIKDAEARIANDRNVFYGSEKLNVDFVIDSENSNINEVAKTIYDLYIEKLKTL